MKITHNVALSFHPIFILLNQIFREILDFGFWNAELLYRFALSLYLKHLDISHWDLSRISISGF